MKSIKPRVRTALERGDIHCNLSCEYHPCHYAGQNCSFCYCPFYPCNDDDLGFELKLKNGDGVWDCSQCLFNHRNDVVDYSFKRFRELGITEPDDPRLRDVFLEAKERFYHRGKALMVLGATSDAGKSVTAAAICRILSRRGFVVTPFKSQNMSLNSRVTVSGHEISMIQMLQGRAAGLRNPSYNVNPILLKPKGDSMSQVIVEGKVFGDYGANAYYDEFVPNHGADIVKRNVDFLKGRYDYIVMEGAGSPAEINIYDKDISNMRAAEIADADCILVINAELGGSFAYAAGTVALIPEKDRKRIKGLIINNVYGSADCFGSGTEELERITGIPVIGIVPHMDIDLPHEDSEYFRSETSFGNGTKKVAVIKLPRIANFTDLDPLKLEDVAIRFVAEPSELEDADLIVIPGTKNTMADLGWMKRNGMFGALKKKAGQVPIIGICGGYQMMAEKLYDPDGIEDPNVREAKGLGLFRMNAVWDSREKTVRLDRGTMNVGDKGEIEGYHIHMGRVTDCKEEPLFTVRRLRGEEGEGSVDMERKLYGTFLHGIFERPAFRKYIMSIIGAKDTGNKDYWELVESDLDRLADTFERSVDTDRLMRILEEKE